MSLKSPDNRFLRLYTAEQSRKLDHDTINFGIDGGVLMEIAGLKASEIIRHRVKEKSSGLYVCGKGNNAGDAFVIARYCSEFSAHSITVLLAAGDEDLSADAEKNLNLLKKLADQNESIKIIKQNDQQLFENADYIVDGMIGTGLSSDIREPFLTCIKMANSSAATTFSLDIPTGLHCDSGLVLGECIQADHTITFGTNKIGFYLNKGPAVTGEVHLADLPFPEHLRQHSATLINDDLAAELTHSVQKAEHKYQKGIVHVIAGSAGMTGAAIMSAKSAWKAGAGAVILYTPGGLLSIYEQTMPEIIKVPVGSKNSLNYEADNAEQILNKIKEKPGTVLLGPGIGRTDESQALARQLLDNLEQPVILDADGLSDWRNLKKRDQSNIIITPHIGELKKSLGINFQHDEERLQEIRKLADKYNTTIVSKGYPTMVISAKYGSFITGYDTRIFAKAGFGDVLAGTIAGKLAVSNKIIESVLAAMLHNLKHALLSADPEPRDIYDR